MLQISSIGGCVFVNFYAFTGSDSFWVGAREDVEGADGPKKKKSILRYSVCRCVHTVSGACRRQNTYPYKSFRVVTVAR